MVGLEFTFDLDDHVLLKHPAHQIILSWEEHELFLTFHEVDLDECHRVAFFGDDFALVGENAAGHDHLVVRECLPVDGDGNAVERMPADIDGQEFLLVLEHNFFVKPVDFEFKIVVEASEEEDRLEQVHTIICRRHQAVEGTRESEHFQSAFVEPFLRNLVEQVLDVVERPRVHDMGHGRLSEPFDGAEPETDVIALDAEPDIRFIDVRRQDVLAGRPGLGHIVRDLGLVVTEDGEECGIELDWIMSLEIGRLIRDVRITLLLSLSRAACAL